jgi:hypothetical protein
VSESGNASDFKLLLECAVVISKGTLKIFHFKNGIERRLA